MIHTLKNLVQRSPVTLLQDAAGAVSLVVMLLAALHLPGVV